MQIYALMDMWVYNLSEINLEEKDLKYANELNMIVRLDSVVGDRFIVGSWNNVIYFVKDYLGLEVKNENLYPLKNVI